MSGLLHYMLGFSTGVLLMAACFIVASIRDQRRQERIRAANRRMDFVHGDRR